MRRSSFVLAVLVATVLSLVAHAQPPSASVPPPAPPAGPPAPTAAPDAAPAQAPVLDAKKLKAPKATPELLAKGKAAFEANCVTCHGATGHGDGPAGLYMDPRPRDFGKDRFKQGATPEEVFVSITHGVKDTAMVGFAHLSEEERWALSHHVLTMVPAQLKKGGKKGK